MTPDAPTRATGTNPEPTRTILPDEAALRRLFDQHADAVATRAATELGEAAELAPKVVEHVFLNAWRSRATLTSEAAFATFLDDAVRHDSARVLSRRMAAHRLGHHGNESARPARGNGNGHAHGAFDRDTAWRHLEREIQGGDADAAHKRAAAIAHHEAAAHIADVGHSRGWLRPALTAVGVGAAALGAIWLLDQASRGAKLNAAVTSSTARVVEARSAQMGALTLDDGSQVRFAPESRLYIPRDFGEDLRGIRVEGAADVTVGTGFESPLVVKAREATLTAQGTRFMVRAYPGDSVTIVVLQEGRLAVQRGDEERTLAPGEAIAIPDSAPIRAPSAAEREEATAWTRKRLEVRDRRLGDALAEFQRWYNMKIFAVDPKILDRPVTISASLDSVRQAIAAVESSAGVQFGYLEDRMIFHDASKSAQPRR